MRRNIILTCILAIGSLFLYGQEPITFLEADQITSSPWKRTVTNGFKNADRYVVLYDTYFGAGSHSIRMVEYDTLGKHVTDYSPVVDYSTPIASSIQKYPNGHIKMIGSGDDSLGRFTGFSYMFDKQGKVLWSNGYDASWYGTSVNDSISVGRLVLKNSSTTNIFLSRINHVTNDTLWSLEDREMLNLGINDSQKVDLRSVVAYNNGNTIGFFSDKWGNNGIVVTVDSVSNVMSRDTLVGVDSIVGVYNMNGKLFFQRSLGTYPNTHMEFIHVDKNSYRIIWKLDRDNLGVNGRLSLRSVSNRNNQIYLHCHTDSITKVWIIDFTGKILKSIGYSVESQWLYSSSLEVLKDGFFITGSTSAFPDYEFIMKTDTNGMVDKPVLFPLKIDTGKMVSISENFDNKQNFLVYPNPAKSVINMTITIVQNDQIPVKYSLFNSKGQVVIDGSFKSKTQIDVSQFYTGIYFLRFQGNGTLETRKIIISH